MRQGRPGLTDRPPLAYPRPPGGAKARAAGVIVARVLLLRLLVLPSLPPRPPPLPVVSGTSRRRPSSSPPAGSPAPSACLSVSAERRLMSVSTVLMPAHHLRETFSGAHLKTNVELWDAFSHCLDCDRQAGVIRLTTTPLLALVPLRFVY